MMTEFTEVVPPLVDEIRDPIITAWPAFVRKPSAAYDEYVDVLSKLAQYMDETIKSSEYVRFRAADKGVLSVIGGLDDYNQIMQFKDLASLLFPYGVKPGSTKPLLAGTIFD